MRNSYVVTSLKRLGPMKLEELPPSFDTELLLQVVDFASVYARTALHGKISYYLAEILTRIRLNNVSNPVEISHANQVARAMIKFFPTASRFWQFVHVF